jgi:DNA polymerase-3 subunit delta
MTPVVLVKGDDPGLVVDAVRKAVDDALGDDDRSFALQDMSGDELTIGSVVDAARTPPMFTSRRVLVVREIGRFSTEELEPLVTYLNEPEPTTSLVLVGGGGATSQRLVNAVKKAGSIVDAGAPSGRGRAAWIDQRLKESPVRFERAAVTAIGDHLGEDLGRLPGLIDMLVSAFGADHVVSADEVMPLLGDLGGVAPWDLTDAIDRGDTAAALLALKRLGDRHPLVILASLHRHFAAMLRLDGSGITGEQEAAAAVAMAPFPAKKAMQQANRLGSAAIARAITLIAGADLDLRGLKDWPDELVLEVLVARLSRLTPSRQSPGRR